MAPNPFGQAVALAARNGGFAVRDVLTAKPRSSRSGPVGRRARVRGRRRVRVEREARDLGRMIGRMMVALARRAEGGDLEALVALRDLDLDLAVTQKRAARALAGPAGYSWAQIALRLGVTKQSAHGRWGG